MKWIDMVETAMNIDCTSGNSMKERLSEACPEFVQRLQSWQHVQAIVERLDPQVLDIVLAQCDIHDIPPEVIPQVWLRDAWMLQPPKIAASTESRERLYGPGARRCERKGAGRRSDEELDSKACEGGEFDIHVVGMLSILNSRGEFMWCCRNRVMCKCYILRAPKRKYT